MSTKSIAVAAMTQSISYHLLPTAASWFVFSSSAIALEDLKIGGVKSEGSTFNVSAIMSNSIQLKGVLCFACTFLDKVA